MKKNILVVLLALLISAVSCKGTGEDGKLSIRIGGDIPVGTVTCVISAEGPGSERVEAELGPTERSCEMELPPGTWNLHISFVGKDGVSYVERNESGIEIKEGETRGLTIRLPEEMKHVARFSPILPGLEWHEPDPVTVSALRNSGIVLDLWYGAEGADAVALEAVIDEFNEVNPYGIRVNAYDQGNPDVLHMKTLSALAAGNGPDIVRNTDQRILEYAASGKILELTPYINDGYGLSEEDFRSLNPVFWKNDGSYDYDRRYATSLGKSADVLYVNQSFLKDNSMEIPRNIRELYISARKATKITGKPSFAVDDTVSFTYECLSGFGTKAHVPGTSVYEGRSAGRAYSFYEWWKKGSDEKIFRDRASDLTAKEPFLRGDSVFLLSGSMEAQSMNPSGFKVRAAAIPELPIATVYADGPGFAGFDSGSELRNLAISIVLEWFYSEEANEIYSSMTGALPSNMAALEPAAKAARGTVKEVLQVLKSYEPSMIVMPPINKDARSFMKILALPTDGAASTSLSIDSLIDQALVKIREM